MTNIPGIPKPPMVDSTPNVSHREYKKAQKSVGEYVGKIRDSGGYGEYDFNRDNNGTAQAASTPAKPNIPGLKYAIQSPRVIPQAVNDVADTGRVKTFLGSIFKSK